MTQSPQVLAEMFGLDEVPVLEPHYNIAPTQDVAAVRKLDAAAKPALVFLRWGLIPSWADDPAIGNKMINAKCETVAEKAAFRDAFARRRCLIPADGFYEWEKAGKERIPYYYEMKGHALFALAGLWERWSHPAGTVESFTILTTDANELVARVHDRMPVIIAPEHYGRWLDPSVEVAEVRPLLTPFPAAGMESYRVSARVNRPEEDSPDLIKKVEDAEPKFL